MTEYQSLKPKTHPGLSELNVVVADTRWETFEQLRDIGEGTNLLNLSSSFAVNFIIDYERIDVILISRRIPGLDGIIRKAHKKNTLVLIMGEDVRYPLDREQITKLLEIERISRSEALIAKNTEGTGSFIKKIFNPGSNRRSHRHARKERKCPERMEKHKMKDRVIQPGDDASLPEQEKEGLNAKVSPDDYDSLFWGEQKAEKYCSASRPVRQQQNDRNDFKPGYDRQEKNKGSQLDNFVTIKQKTIVFLKAKGGVGSTLLSLFIAYHFRKLKTLLVDLNFCEGGSDIGYYLNIPKTPNMIVFIEGYNRNAMENSVVKIKENLDVLQAPPTYELSRRVDLQDIYSMVDIARKKYHLIIFDLPNQINDIYLGVLDIADLAVMVSDFTAGSVGRLISINQRFIYDDMEKMLVLNRSRNGNGSNFLNDHAGGFFKTEEVLILKENDLLNRKMDFSEFDFSRIEEFSCLADRVLGRLTCE